jgi:mannose-1-phosphate guanylyltransferase / phosphomannomutase
VAASAPAATVPPVRALVLAAGHGTRLRPLTDALPKPLAPVGGRPVVEHLLARLPGAGVDAAVLNLHWRGDQLRARLGAATEDGLPLAYAEEPVLLGSAGALRGAAALLGDGDVLVLNGDGFHDVDLAGLVARHREAGAAATITVKQLPDPTSCAIVARGGDGLVTRFVEKPAPEAVFTDLASIGLYVFSPAALREVPPGRPSDIAGDLVPALLERGLPVAAYETDAWWTDIGTPADLADANFAVADGRARTARPAAREGDRHVYEGSVVEAGAVLVEPVVVGPLARIGAGARVERALVLPGGVVAAGARATGVVGDPEAVAAAWRRT